MLYRPLFLLLSLLHSSFIAKHLTMNSLPSMRASNRTVFLSFFPLSLSLSRSFYFEYVCMYVCMHFIRLSIGQTVILRVKEREYRSHFYLSVFLLADVAVMVLVIICVHRRSSVLSCRSKVVVVVVVMHFFPRILLFDMFCFFSLSLSLARARIYSLFLTEKNTKRYHDHCIIAISTAVR
jgi:hypothetical protein